jgi:hypothetical protein
MRGFHVTIAFQPLLIELIVPVNASHVICTVLHRTNRARLCWGEQGVVLEMEAQTSERIEQRVVFT